MARKSEPPDVGSYKSHRPDHRRGRRRARCAACAPRPCRSSKAACARSTARSNCPAPTPLKDAHAALNAAVLAAYGFDAKQDLLAQLLALNLAVAARIERGESVTAPGLPTGFPEPEKLVTEDCIRPPRR